MVGFFPRWWPPCFAIEYYSHFFRIPLWQELVEHKYSLLAIFVNPFDRAEGREVVYYSKTIRYAITASSRKINHKQIKDNQYQLFAQHAQSSLALITKVSSEITQAVWTGSVAPSTAVAGDWLVSADPHPQYSGWGAS